MPDMHHWAAFVRRMAQQYRGRINHWVIWNEPDVWDMANPGSTWAGSVEDYARLLKTAYLAIKDVDPAQQVLMAGQTYFWDWSHGRRRYLDRLLDAIAADPEAPAHGYYFDAIPYHLYFNPSQTPGVLAEARATLKKHGITGKELWINETNAPPVGRSTGAALVEAALPYHPGGAGGVCASRSSAWRLLRGPAGWQFYKLRNSADHPESIEPYGLLRADDSPRPALICVSGGSDLSARFPYRSTLERQGDVIAVHLRPRRPDDHRALDERPPACPRDCARHCAPGRADRSSAARCARCGASRGVYTIDLPGAACTNGAPCMIGGAPRLLVEAGASAGRRALAAPVRPAAAAKPAPTPPASPRP